MTSEKPNRDFIVVPEGTVTDVRELFMTKLLESLDRLQINLGKIGKELTGLGSGLNGLNSMFDYKSIRNENDYSLGELE